MMTWVHSGQARWVTLIAVVMVAALVTLAMRWAGVQPCHRIDLRGMQQADTASLMRLAHPSDSSLSAKVIADRVRRHPWVRWSTATCYPTGRLVVRVEERIPVLLAVDEEGRGAYFVDPAGFMMPVTERSQFDVPILRGLNVPFHAVRPVAEPTVQELARALALIDDETDALLSEFLLTPEGVRLYTEPVHGGATTEVWLGREAYLSRLNRLRSFWEQRVSPFSARTYESIDLRFAGQIVTRESPIE